MYDQFWFHKSFSCLVTSLMILDWSLEGFESPSYIILLSRMTSSERFFRSFLISISVLSIIGWLCVCDVRGLSWPGMDGRDSRVFNIMNLRRRL